MLNIIANVCAGHRRAKKVLQRAEKWLRQKEIPYRVYISEYAGHTVELARSLKDGDAPVVALGGDGTISEVAQGLQGGTAPMGMIPAGSGNDYRRCFKIPTQPEKALERLLQGNIRPVDTMELNGRTFLNIINIGFDNAVAQEAEKYKFLGKLSYFVAIFGVLFRYRATRMRITADGQTLQGKFLLVCAGCGTHYGGGMRPLPDSDPGDGLMDVTVISEVSKPKFLWLLPKYMIGKYAHESVVTTLRTAQLCIECPDGPLSLGGDGEIMESTSPAHLRIAHHSLRVLV